MCIIDQTDLSFYYKTSTLIKSFGTLSILENTMHAKAPRHCILDKLIRFDFASLQRERSHLVSASWLLFICVKEHNVQKGIYANCSKLIGYSGDGICGNTFKVNEIIIIFYLTHCLFCLQCQTY